MAANPFRYDRPLGPGEGARRAAEQDRLVELARSGQSARLSAARRMGKTTLIGDVCAQLRREGFICATADLSGLHSAVTLAERLADAWRVELAGSRPGRRLWRELSEGSSWEAELRVAGVGRIARSRQRPASGHLGELLDLPRTVFRRLERRCYVVFDEFQEVLNSPESLDGEIRSRIQHHGESASYCFAGSQASQMRALFAESGRPLYAQAEPVEVSFVPEEVIAYWLIERFEAAELPIDERTALAVAKAGAGHPQRTSLIANRLFEGGTATVGDVEAAATEAYELAGGEVTLVWDHLSGAERDVVWIVAEGLAPTGKQAVGLTGRSKSTLADRRNALLGEAVLIEAPEGLRVVDPFLARFVLS